MFLWLVYGGKLATAVVAEASSTVSLQSHNVQCCYLTHLHYDIINSIIYNTVAPHPSLLVEKLGLSCHVFVVPVRCYTCTVEL